jgi:predicted phosphodiesterase
MIHRFYAIIQLRNLLLRYSLVLSMPLVLLALTACGHIFDVHPYDMNIDGEHNINATNIARIEALCANKDTIRFAVISDSHLALSDLAEEVTDINRRDSIDFVLHLGDLTETGTTKEFEWARRELQKLSKPYVALIGNHDFLGTGEQLYEWMFGEHNFSFIVNGIKFVALDTNAMEYDRMADIPNFAFMEQEARTDSIPFSRTVIMMHAAPYSDEFNNNVSKAFDFYVRQFPGLMFCLYGHDHQDTVRDIFNNGIIYYGINSSAHRTYHIFTITPNGYEQQKIDF